jgi:hypothetical protein
MFMTFCEDRRVRLLFVGLAMPLVTALVTSTTSAQELRYTSKPQQKFAYKVDISADRNDATEFLKGVVTFTIKDSSAETVRIAYYGGLTKTRKAKPGTSSGGPSRGPRRGPGGPPRRGGPSIFSNPFAGLTQVGNELVATPRGEVQLLTGTSQLPYLLGNLSVMFFEPLPEAGEKQWTVRNGVSITEGGGRSSRPPFFRPGPSAAQEKITAASESTMFEIESSSDKLVVVSKTYKLNMPAAADEDTGFEITGTGKWTFNRELQVPESLDFKQQLVVHDANTTVTIPVSISYKRLSPEELAAYQKQREEMIADLRKKQEDRKKAGNSGLPAEKKKQILANLNSDKKQVITNQMVQLKIMKPHPDDKDIALLIQKYIEDSHRPLRVMAQAAWGRWKVLVEKPEAATIASDDNPFAPATETNRVRTWKDATGKFTIEAEFISLTGDNIKLKRKDGKEITVPLSRLSEEDRQAARQLAK